MHDPSDQTIILQLDGEIDLDTFAAAVSGLRELANALVSDLAPHAGITWELQGLEYGSASVALRAESQSRAAARRVTRAYGEIGAAMSEDRHLAYSPKIGSCARKLGSLTGRQRVQAVRFGAGGRTAAITKLGQNSMATLEQLSSLGSVTGQIESLSRRGDLHLTLVDDVFASRVSLHLRKGQEELGRSSWDLHATVTGMVIEDPGSGRPTDVRNITSIEPVPEFQVGAWRDARGALPWKPGDPPAEQTIRELRGRA